MIEIRIIDDKHKTDINLKNEPFKLDGLMLPSYINGSWDYTIIKFPLENQTEMKFPDENYDYDEMSGNHTFIGAYEEDRCIGLAIMRDDFFKYMYLYDLKVNAEYRGKGIGAMLIEQCKQAALARGYRGIYTQGQDNNLGACRFYLKCGFRIGGLNTFGYNGTSQENKKDIFFYIDALPSGK